MSKNYFCYSSALDTEALEIWKSQHGYPLFKLEEGDRVTLPGYELVFNFPSRFWGGRVAGLKIASDPKKSVEGILFSIPDELWPAVEHKEGVVTGASAAIEISVRKSDGKMVQALAFTTHPSRESLEGPISQTFTQVILKAYAHWKLPTDLIERREE